MLAERPDLRASFFDVSDMYVDYWRALVPESEFATFETPEEWQGAFDAVVSFFMLEHVADPARVVDGVVHDGAWVVTGRRPEVETTADRSADTTVESNIARIGADVSDAAAAREIARYWTDLDERLRDRSSTYPGVRTASRGRASGPTSRRARCPRRPEPHPRPLHRRGNRRMARPGLDVPLPVISGETTELREFRAADLDVLTALRNDVEVQRLLLARPRPNTTERVQEWVTRLGEDPQAALFVVAVDGTAIGFVQITAIDPISAHCRLGIAISPEHHGRGHGREALELAAAYLRATFSVHKVVLEVIADNERAIGLYRSAGFREVGVLAEHFKHDGMWSDVVIMERLLDR